ncbi:uncharacterized protein LOC135366829 isoform X1 [Ornithodoros turicata]|uniref:uncharacterized protein LOC135366829 isoform X1 n=1 Tax=Ornithodoros turicata TaxID=34597 RepID=UPI003138EA39
MAYFRQAWRECALYKSCRLHSAYTLLTVICNQQGLTHALHVPRKGLIAANLYSSSSTIMMNTCAVIMALFALAYAGDYDDAQVIISQQPDYHYKPQPYTFGYEIKDEWGNTQHRREDSDEYNTKRGSYGFTDARGIYRKVEYVADGHGFRAVVKTNEPGTASQNPAHAHFHSSALHVPAHVLQQQHTVPVYVAVAQPIEESHHSKHNGGGYGHY